MSTFKTALGLSVLSLGFMVGTAKVTAQPSDAVPPTGAPSTPVRTTDDRRDFDFDLGWLGLIGLAGLAGLMGRDRTVHNDVRHTGSAGPSVAR